MAEALRNWILEKMALGPPPTTKIHNNSGIPIFLIPISWVDGPDPLSHSVVRKDLVKQIPAGGFKAVDCREHDPGGNTPASQIRILFRAGHTNNDEEFLGNLKVEPGEELYSPHYLSEKCDLFLGFNEAGQVIEVDKNSVQISGMEFFRKAQAVRLRNCHGQFLVANKDLKTVALSGEVTNVSDDEETVRRREAIWRKMEDIIRRHGARLQEMEKIRRRHRARLQEMEEEEMEDRLRRRDRARLEDMEMEDNIRRYRARLKEMEDNLRRRDKARLEEMVDNLRRRDRARSEEMEEEIQEEMRRLPPQRDNGWWYVEFVVKSDSVLHLKSCYDTYLTASGLISLAGMTGCKVLQSPPPLPDFSLELEPVKAGNQVKLRTHNGTFICANGSHPHWPDSVTHDLSPSTAILWDVEVVERVEERTATNTDDKASEEGSTSNIDDKASSATKRCYETGEGSSVTKTPSGDSGLIREVDWARYRHHFWELKRRLLDNSGSNDLLVRGGWGTTALVREVCADVREHFGTIAWISIPQENNSSFINEEILLQLIFERAAFPDMNTWMLKDHQFSLQQKARCLIVVDNLDDPKTWKKFEEILLIVKTCQVIFIARSNKDSSYSQIKKRSHDFESYELKDLFHLPAGHYLKNFLEEAFPSKRVYQLIVKKCQRLPTAIVFVLRNQYKLGQCPSSDIIKGEWWAGIPSDNLFDEFHVIQQVLKTLYQDLEGIDDDKLDPIQKVSKILREDNNIICLLYLSILPENRPLSCKTVSRLWAAEGFPINLERAEVFLKRLEKVCIKPVEKRSDGGFSTFQVDKCVRKILISLSDIITSQGGTNWPFRCLFVQGTIRAFREEKTFELSSIFMPEVSSNEDETTTFEASPWDLKHSKVLDLTNASFQIIPDELFELTNARYLSLRNTPIKVIPGSIKKLRHLEFLDAKHSLVTKLPQQVARLKKIRHILIYHHEKDPMMENYNLIGFKALCGVGGLKCLEKLCFVEADKRTLEDLANLTKLRRLGITKLRKEHGELLCSSLGQLKELKSLNVHALDEDEILDLHSSPHHLDSPPKSLKHLYLHGCLEKLPDWISSLDGLTRIMLRWSQLKEDLLATLGKLRNLVELELQRAYDGEQLDFKNGQFPKLKILLLEELEGLRSMSFEQGTLPHLDNLIISRCQWLERIPSGIELIPSIKELTFLDMSHELFEKIREDPEKDNYRIAKIPKVNFRRWRAGHWEPYQVESTDEARQEKNTDEVHRSHQVESNGGIRLED
ncbi:hypothetical protein BT93_E0989 [Corymbia citriodora subsp. variegata]|nr:hypothetical protein BT93_E0989 [Corymbia citriodora subsp. variegata]